MKETQFIKLFTTIFLFLSSITLLNSCAVTEEKINIDYISQKDVPHVEGAEKVTVIVNVSDVRSIKDKVSCKKNGYGIEMGSIKSNENIADIVKSAINEEIRKRGFNINDGSVTVGVELTRFYNDFKVGFFSGNADAEIIFNIQVRKSNGDIKYAKAFTELHSEKGIMLSLGHNAKIALDKALKNGVVKLMSDDSFIKAILNSGSE